MSMAYDSGAKDLERNWSIVETEFDADYQGKCEAIMSQGNGYLGCRAAFDENYCNQVRNTFVTGTFSRYHESEVTELPNAPDVCSIRIRIDGETFTLMHGTVEAYCRRLDLKTGELTRSVEWVSPKGNRVRITFGRFVSMSDKHLICSQVCVESLEQDVELSVISGIDGQQTNSGTQHFIEGEKRIHDKRFIELVQQTTESAIDFVVVSNHTLKIDGDNLEVAPGMNLDRRQVSLEYGTLLRCGQKLCIEKQSRFFTSSDQEFSDPGIGVAEIRQQALRCAKQTAATSYEDLLAESAAKWQDIWDSVDVEIEGNDFDQLAVRFALYHMFVFTPAHDARFGIGAKGLSGEGYKGHSFWDSEIFILPCFIFAAPEIARGLLEYRYRTLGGARANAGKRGYEGAMYAWESAATGEEETPEWGAVDIHTGEPTKIWSGFIEQHITADIAYAVWTYYRVTGDQSFMNEMGYEIIFETATFWTSRLEWLDDRKQWGIKNVVGPDEYKERVDNNAFTNYMAEHNIRLAIAYYAELQESDADTFSALAARIPLRSNYEFWCSRVDSIYLPQPRADDSVIPQDDTYLAKSVIDLSRYKNQAHVGTLFDDYNLEQVNEMQVSKQADVVALFWLLRHKFDSEQMLANWRYYEPKTLHDSSLSLSAHVGVACEVGDSCLAYELFERAARIDLGPGMTTSDHGIHAAAMGGIWQSVVAGFGGVKVIDRRLHIDHKLPRSWSRLRFGIFWQGQRLQVDIDKQRIVVSKNPAGDSIFLQIHGVSCTVTDTVEVHV